MTALTALRGETGAKGSLLERIRTWRSVGSLARRLHDQAVAQSRLPELYAEMGVADSPEGRFEALVLHVLLLMGRLRKAGTRGRLLSQRLFDTFLSNLDGALREMAVGDLAVPKRMRRLGEAFYGRARTFDAALAALPDEAELKAVIRRTLLEGRGGDDPSALAAYVIASRDALDDQSEGEVLAGDVRWPRLRS